MNLRESFDLLLWLAAGIALGMIVYMATMWVMEPYGFIEPVPTYLPPDTG